MSGFVLLPLPAFALPCPRHSRQGCLTTPSLFSVRHFLFGQLFYSGLHHKQKAVKQKDLMPLLTQAREENPLLIPPQGIDGPGSAKTSL